MANATGCSSIYGGNLPTTPWSVNKQGRGPAWANSLFEDNAEFGLGFRLSLDKQREEAERLLAKLAPQLGPARVRELLDAPQVSQEDVDAQRNRVAALEEMLKSLADPTAHRLRTIAKHLVRKSVWIVGGDGWAYDIGYGGLDHVLASGRNVNILVLDTEVYSNTGGQASKSTPRGGVAKFAAGGKQGRKKDLGLMAVAYGTSTSRKLPWAHHHNRRWMRFSKPRRTMGRRSSSRTATASPTASTCGSGCVSRSWRSSWALATLSLQAASGRPGAAGVRAQFQAPSIPLKAYAYNEIRYKMLSYTNPSEAKGCSAWRRKTSISGGASTPAWPTGGRQPRDAASVRLAVTFLRRLPRP